jgi:rhodanese-related sulfurtransferase
MYLVLHLHRARDRLRRGALLVDVEKPSSVERQHPDVAMSIPLEELAHRVHEIGEPSRAIVVVAHAWRRGHQAVRILREYGYNDVYNAGGARLTGYVSAVASDVPEDERPAAEKREQVDLESEEAFERDKG